MVTWDWWFTVHLEQRENNEIGERMTIVSINKMQYESNKDAEEMISDQEAQILENLKIAYLTGTQDNESYYRQAEQYHKEQLTFCLISAIFRRIKKYFQRFSFSY